MKKKNSVSEFSSERNLRLLEIFRKHLAERSHDAAEKAFGLAATTPAPRFWVSESRAAAVVGRLLAGEDVTSGMYPEKREMYLEIFRRFKELKRQRPDEAIASLVFEVVNSPAPRSYLSEATVKSIIYRESRRRRAERRMK